MFTGIIRHLGLIKVIDRTSTGVLVRIEEPALAKEVQEGDSVAVNGACLTVLDNDDDTLLFRLMDETLQKTTLGTLVSGATVNLERPLTLGAHLDGHFVQGHVDGTATVTDITSVGDDRVLQFTVTADLLPLLIPKGSVTLDGVSLTVVDILPDGFTVSCMPYTLEHTTLGTLAVGDAVNIEVDMLGKYVQRFAANISAYDAAATST